MVLEDCSRLIRMKVSKQFYSDSRNSLPLYVIGVDHGSGTNVLPQDIKCAMNFYKKLYICTFIVRKINMLKLIFNIEIISEIGLQCSGF